MADQLKKVYNAEIIKYLDNQFTRAEENIQLYLDVLENKDQTRKTAKLVFLFLYQDTFD